MTIVDKLRAVCSSGTGGSVTVSSSAGNISMEDTVAVRGAVAGSITIAAPAGTVTPRERFGARGQLDGGTVSLSAATIDMRGDIDARGGDGTGGTIQLLGSTLAQANRAKFDASGYVNGGSIALLGDAGSGDVALIRSGFIAKGNSGLGGTVTISAPAGSVNIDGKAAVYGKNGQGGQVAVDGVAITVGGKTIFYARDGGEVRLEQTGAGLFTLQAAFAVHDGGVVEALAPAGSLTALGKAVTDGGCVGMSAGGTLDTTAFASDVAITPSCP